MAILLYAEGRALSHSGLSVPQREPAAVKPPVPYRPTALPIVFTVVGAMLCAHYGERWYRLEPLPPELLAQSVELNYALDLAREAPVTPPDAAEARRRKAAIADELRAEDERARREVAGPLGIGLLMLVFGLATAVASRLLGRGAT
jgi:hypothetical protein